MYQFTNYAWGDFELRARDRLYLHFQNGQIIQIDNETIGVNYVITRPAAPQSSGCLGVILFLILIPACIAWLA